jgi:hypothetical protein
MAHPAAVRMHSVAWGIVLALVVLTDAPIGGGEAPGARPILELRPGERYFRLEGTPRFVLGRNPVGRRPEDYDDHFRHAAAAGERLVRLHFTYASPREQPGQVDPGVLQGWDAVLDAAEARGLGVLPVFGVWADWNDGSHGEPWHAWDKNPFCIQRGGPARRPVELFEESACRSLWLRRLETLVKHWAPRRAIVGWEVFSELDLVTGASEDKAVAFANRAAEVVRRLDPWKRPVTASQAGVNEWPKLLKGPALDVLEVHPYAAGRSGGRLDDLIFASVRQRLARYHKPVLLGESGLDSAPPRGTLDVAPGAAIGVRHAIWAAVVSGAMNGRMLWWQDGYDQFEGVDVCRHYQQAAAAAASFVADVDFLNVAPLPCVLSNGLKGAAVGNDRIALAWFRDARCVPPDWPRSDTSGEHVTLDVASGAWRVEFIDTESGKRTGQRDLTTHGPGLRIDLPVFRGSLAVRSRQLTP